MYLSISLDFIELCMLQTLKMSFLLEFYYYLSLRALGYISLSLDLYQNLFDIESVFYFLSMHFLYSQSDFREEEASNDTFGFLSLILIKKT